MLATLSERPFFAPGWVYEPKLDGERCIAFRSGGREVRLMSRNRKELNGNYPDFIVDGEVVALENGRPSFSKLQPRMQTRDPDKAMRSGVPVYYYLFDLLYYEGHSLMALPLSLRKEVLKNTFSFQDPIRYTSHVEAEEAEKYLAGLCAGGWEGVIAKKADGPYLEKRSRDWLKFKCGKEQEFIILGYTDPSGARTGFGALLIGYYKDGKLLYAGKVGTGYDEHTLKTLGATLEEMRIEGSPPALQPHKEIPHRGVHWVEPSLIAQVAFSEWTPDGLLRHPRFKGLRRDKFPREVGLEKPGA
jgi:DNA ligase D-like protein (predicted ligase)